VVDGYTSAITETESCGPFTLSIFRMD
jgi:hypothetical protein